MLFVRRSLSHLLRRTTFVTNDQLKGTILVHIAHIDVTRICKYRNIENYT